MQPRPYLRADVHQRVMDHQPYDGILEIHLVLIGRAWDKAVIDDYIVVVIIVALPLVQLMDCVDRNVPVD